MESLSSMDEGDQQVVKTLVLMYWRSDVFVLHLAVGIHQCGTCIAVFVLRRNMHHSATPCTVLLLVLARLVKQETQSQQRCDHRWLYSAFRAFRLTPMTPLGSFKVRQTMAIR